VITPPGTTVTSPGTLAVVPAGPITTYTFTVTDSNGLEDSGEVTVDVVAAPTLTAAAPVIGPGGATQLVAEFDDSHGETATVDNGVGAVTNGAAVATPALDQSTPFTLTVSRAGQPFATATALVRVARLVVFAGQPSGQGSLGTLLGDARYLRPGGMAMDAAGDLFLADMASHIIRKVTPRGAVSIFAGAEGIPGSADGRGGAARFNRPMAVAVGPVSGNLYVADAGNDTLRMITPGAAVTTLSGSAGVAGDDEDPEGTADATFNQPTGIAVNPGETFAYVADTGNRSIRAINLAVPSVETLSTGPFLAPGALAWDPINNRLLVADTGGDAICSVEVKGGTSIVVAGAPGEGGSTDGSGTANEPGTNARFLRPAGLVVDQAAGLAVVADTGNSMLRTVDLDSGDYTVRSLAGTALTPGAANGAFAAALFRHPQGLAVDAAGDLLVADTGNALLRQLPVGAAGAAFAGTVIAYSGVGPQKGSTDTGAPGGPRFDHPARMAWDGQGNLIVADRDNHLLRKVAPDGTVTTLAGTPGAAGTGNGTIGPGGAGVSFNAPSGLVIDPAGIIYVADSGNGAIRKLVPGTGGAPDVVGTLAIGFARPVALALDGAGYLIVVDQGADTILRLSPDGTSRVTLAGTAGEAGATNGAIGPGVTSPVTFNAPAGLAIWKGNIIYVADSGNDLVRVIVLEADGRTGVVSTLAGVELEPENPLQPGVYDGIGDAARLNAPEDIALDASGDLVVANAGSSTVCLITPQGLATTILGSHAQSGTVIGTLPASISPPSGVAVDPASGAIFVSLDDAILKLAFQ
jgi:DNA-binding beta-propeller fold protein YncE